MTGTIGITAWTRLEIDEHQRDDQFLNDRTFGVYQQFRKMFVALQMFDPLNKTGNQILTEPMRLTDPGFTPRPRNPAGWGGVAAQYEISWLADLSIATIPSAVEP
jgi:hypothetical protein